MRKSKKIIAFTLALILAFSVMVVGASTINAGALSKISITSISYNKDASVSLSWSKDSSCSYYQIAKKKLGDKSYTYTNASYFSTYYNDRNVVSGTIYYYQIRSVSMLKGGKKYGPWSSTKTITTLYRPTITSLNDSLTNLNINWNKIKGASHYRLAFKRLTDRAWNYRTVKNTYYNVPYPTLEATYAVQVCPMNGSIAGQWSEVRYIVIGTSYVKPEIESVSIGLGDDNTSVIWYYPFTCEKYYLYVQKAGDGYWTHNIIDDTKGYYNYAQANLQNGNTYYFQVRAQDKYGNWSPFSKVYTYQAKELDESEKKDLRKMITSHKWRYTLNDEDDYMKLNYDWLLEFKEDGTWVMDMDNSVDDDSYFYTLRGTWRLDGTTLTTTMRDEEISEFDETDLFIFADDMTDEIIEKDGIESIITPYPDDLSEDEMLLYMPQLKWYVSGKYFCLSLILFTAEELH